VRLLFAVAISETWFVGDVSWVRVMNTVCPLLFEAIVSADVSSQDELVASGREEDLCACLADDADAASSAAAERDARKELRY
jgi:hypothetical protein